MGVGHRGVETELEKRLIRCEKSVQVLHSTVSGTVARRERGEARDEEGEGRAMRGRILAEQQMMRQIYEKLAKIGGGAGTAGEGNGWRVAGANSVTDV